MKHVQLVSRLLAVLFSVSLVTASFAQPFSPQQPPRWGKGLNLSPEQQQKISQLRLEYQKKNLPLRAKLVELRNELKLLLVSDTYSQTKAERLLEKIGNIRKQMALNRLTLKRKVRDLLTPEQRLQFDARILSSKKRGSRHVRFHHSRMPALHPKMQPPVH